MEDVSELSLSKRLTTCNCKMLCCSLSRQAYCIHSCCMCQNESKILSSQPLSCASGLSRNRGRQTTAQLHCRTLLFSNENTLLYTNEQPSNNKRQLGKLESNTFRSRQQRTR